jgi:hypothetical protein
MRYPCRDRDHTRSPGLQTDNLDGKKYSDFPHYGGAKKSQRCLAGIENKVTMAQQGSPS